MKVVQANEGPPPAKKDIAFNNIYALNEGMFPIYENNIRLYTQHFRDRHNLIMALFSAKGGRLILYRKGVATPIEAPSVPNTYRMAKAVGHCAMVTEDLVAPYCGNSAGDLSWRGEMAAYRARVQTALDSLADADLENDDRELLRDTLNKIAAFHDKCLATNTFTATDVETWARDIKPNLVKLIGVATKYQVGHWFKVMEDWKKMLGSEWENTYGLSNAIYVARQNNILFSVLAQFFGEKAMNDRLLLLETTDFTASPEDMMTSFIRIISDRALGMAFYKNYRLMDYELLGGGGRKQIIAECERRGQKPFLPPLVPFNSTAWPWKSDPSTGSGPASLDDIQ